MDPPVTSSETTSGDPRARMVERQLRARAIGDGRVLDAMEAIPREELLPPGVAYLAYEDQPLPVGDERFIPPPYVVALVIESLQPQPGDRVLQLGDGSAYASAVLAEIAAQVHLLEPDAALAETARQQLVLLGYDNVEVHRGDPATGWPEGAPYQGIAVMTEAAEAVAAPLLEQLAIGGRLVTVSGGPRCANLVRITRVGRESFVRQELGAIQFIPLVDQASWCETRHDDPAGSRWLGMWPPRKPSPVRARLAGPGPGQIARLVTEAAERLESIEGADLAPLLDRIGQARVVLLGGATHGTSEFYRMRARITRELVLRRGFNVVATEASWTDATRMDRYVRGAPAASRPPPAALDCFPSWLWRNEEAAELIEWARAYNQEVPDPERQVSFAGLDFHDAYASMREVLLVLERMDPALGRAARERFGRLSAWSGGAADRAGSASSDRLASAEEPILSMLRDDLARRLEEAVHAGDGLLGPDWARAVLSGAADHHAALYRGAPGAWSALRDQHMFECLRLVLARRGPPAKVVLWAHNAHVGDSAATEMAARAGHDLGHLCRVRFGAAAYSIGFGTDRGTVCAARAWGGPTEVMDLRPAHAESYERICREAGPAAFLLPLRTPARDPLREVLMEARLQRAIGAVYRPESEHVSHYQQVMLPAQFDEYIWFEESQAVTPLPSASPRRRRAEGASPIAP